MAEISETLKQRDAEEVLRSREEAQETELTPCEVERYLAPPARSAFPLEYTFHLVGDIANKTVFDIGCGTGESVVVLVHKGAHVIGMDISPELIELASRRLHRFQAHFLQCLVESLIDQPDAFRVILIGGFHLERPLEIVQYRQ